MQGFNDKEKESKNRRKGLIVSTIVHLCAACFVLLPLLTFPDPPPPKEGILVSLGRPDEGMGNDRPMVGKPDGDLKATKDKPEAVKPPNPPPPKAVSKPAPQHSTPKEKVMTTEDPDAVALKREKETARKKEKLQRETEDRIIKQKAQAEEAERRRATAEKEKYSQAKSKYGDMFKNGGSGRGNTNKPGNQGDPNGDPNSDVLTGKSTGTGKIGGGLQGRGGKGPVISQKFSDEGTVVIYVCIGSDGRVISADYTQSGSSSTSSTLISLAKENARRYGFKPSDVDKQCGTITYNFSLK